MHCETDANLKSVALRTRIFGKEFPVFAKKFTASIHLERCSIALLLADDCFLIKLLYQCEDPEIVRSSISHQQGNFLVISKYQLVRSNLI